ncbi:MAG: type II toxin-antitoxin system RelE family toxin [Mycobacteriales bacterium]
MYQVEVKRAALKYIAKLPRAARQRMDAAVSALATDPHPSAAERLINGETGWRLRVGDWRVLYDVYDDRLVVEVVRVTPRGDAYKQHR